MSQALVSISHVASWLKHVVANDIVWILSTTVQKKCSWKNWQRYGSMFFLRMFGQCNLGGMEIFFRNCHLVRHNSRVFEKKKGHDCCRTSAPLAISIGSVLAETIAVPWNPLQPRIFYDIFLLVLADQPQRLWTMPIIPLPTNILQIFRFGLWSLSRSTTRKNKSGTPSFLGQILLTICWLSEKNM